MATAMRLRGLLLGYCALQCRNRRRNDLSPVSKLFHEQFPLSKGVEVLRFLPSTHYPLYDFETGPEGPELED